MNYYRVAKLILQSRYVISTFAAFACEPAEADVIIEGTEEQVPVCTETIPGGFICKRLPGEWYFSLRKAPETGIFVSDDYSRIRFAGVKGDRIPDSACGLVRMSLECWLARHGCISLHSAAVECQGEAFLFSGPSGIGKSTRAVAWQDAFSAELINGDRPSIDVRNLVVYGVPWDGKEQCFRNVCYPLKAIFEVRRCGMNYIRAMSLEQKRNLLFRQCFIPMFDVETAAIQITNITRLAKTADIVRLFGGPNAEDARALRSALQDHQYLKEETDMKAKSGFVLRNIVDEYILMPTGDNISKFKGTVLLNEVSAFVWEQLETPISKEDLLNAVLSEFEVERAVAAADLDALLEKLRGYGVIEDD